jgi:hypothetical protein
MARRKKALFLGNKYYFKNELPSIAREQGIFVFPTIPFGVDSGQFDLQY